LEKDFLFPKQKKSQVQIVEIVDRSGKWIAIGQGRWQYFLTCIVSTTFETPENRPKQKSVYLFTKKRYLLELEPQTSFQKLLGYE
jgi:hypothetical protein